MRSNEIIRTKGNRYLAKLLHYSQKKKYGAKYSIETLNQIDKVIISSLNENKWDSRDISVFLDPLSDYGLADFFINYLDDDEYCFVKESAAESVLDKFINYIEICVYEKYSENSIRYILNSTYKITIVIILLLSQLNDPELVKKYQNILDYHVNVIFYMFLMESMINNKVRRNLFRDYLLILSRLLIMMAICNNEKQLYDEIIDVWVLKLIYNINNIYQRFILEYNTKNKNIVVNRIFQNVSLMYPYLKLIKTILIKKMPNLNSINEIDVLLTKYRNDNMIEDKKYPNFWPSPELGKFPEDCNKKVNRLLNKTEEEIMNEIFSRSNHK